MDTQNTQEEINKDWLLHRGYTLRQAAKKLNCTHVHIFYVLSGRRESRTLIQKLRALPQRPIRLRERTAH